MKEFDVSIAQLNVDSWIARVYDRRKAFETTVEAESIEALLLLVSFAITQRIKQLKKDAARDALYPTQSY